MRRAVPRAILLSVAGALAALASLVISYGRYPGFKQYDLDLSRDLPPILTGVYPIERSGRTTFAWTSARATLTLSGLDRSVAWDCRVRARGARPADRPQPVLELSVDGVTRTRQALTNDFAAIGVAVPADMTRSGLSLGLGASPPFVPGPSDRRELGVQLTAIGCTPGDAVPWPPAAALFGIALATALLGGSLGLLGVPLKAALPLVAGVALMLGLSFGLGAAPYGEFPRLAARVSAWIAAATVLAAAACSVARRGALSDAARVAIGISAAALLVESAGLLHPSKALVDAVFHAHRLEWVMDGRYLFTQPMPSGVRFPYAIALYVVAAPWARLVADHVVLLKMVVLVARAIAGLLLYAAVARAWGDRVGGVAAVALYHASRLPFGVIGNANLTFAFGQSLAVAALVAAVFVGRRRHGWARAAVLWALASLAFLSHVGIFPLLLAGLLAAAAGFWWLGRPALGRAAALVAAAAVLAATFSVVTYYGHFGEAYRTLARVRAAEAVPGIGAPGTATAGAPQDGRPGRQALPVEARLARVARLAPWAFGAPLLLLAGIGGVATWRAGWRDPLAVVVAATIGAAVAFVAGSVAAPVEPAFWRYTEEFVARVYGFAMPAVVILGARAVSRGWARRGVARAGVVALCMAAFVGGAQAWFAWLA